MARHRWLQALALRGEGLVRDVLFAVRLLRKAPLFTITIVATLALAISVNVIVFGAINAVLIKQLPFASGERLAFICNPVIAGSKRPACNASAFESQYVKAILSMHGPVEQAAMFQIGQATVTGFGVPQTRTTAWASTSLFEVLKARPELGRFFDEPDGRPGVRSVVISDRLWRSVYSGREDVLGKSILLDGASYQIVGVAPPGFVTPNPADGELRPEAVDLFEAASNDESGWKAHETQFPLSLVFATMIVRIQSGVPMDAAQAQLDRFNAPFLLYEVHKLHLQSVSVLPNPMFVNARSWYSSLNNASSLLIIALLAALAVLLIACANVANLLLARGTARQNELAIRGALGGTRAQLIQQLSIEMFVLVLTSGIMGIALAFIELRFLTLLNPNLLPRMQDISFDGRVVFFMALTMIIVAVLGGIAPAFLTTQQNLASTLKASGRGRDGSGGRMFRSSLVVLQIAVAFTVLVCAALLVRSFSSIAQRPVGFEQRNVYIAAIDLPTGHYGSSASWRTFMDAALGRIRAIPGVESVVGARGSSFLLKNYLRYGDDRTVGIIMPGQAGPISTTEVTSPYFQSMGIPIIQGRDFNERDRPGSPQVLVVSEYFKKLFFPKASPIGKRVHISIGLVNTQATIVGLVGPVLAGAGVPWSIAYVPFSQYPTSRFELSIRTGTQDPHLRENVASAIATIDPNVGLDRFDALSDEINEDLAPERTSAVLFSVLAMVALVLALGGIYAIVTYTVERRTNEFGVRKALGAQMQDILRTVLAGAAAYALVGIAVGVVLAALSTGALSGLLIQTSPFDPLTFIVVIAFLFVSTLGAAAIPALRAMQIDPAVALRYE